jgi:hypothetical protein
VGDALGLGELDYRGGVAVMTTVRMVERAGFALMRSRSQTVQHVGMSVWHLGTRMHRVHLRRAHLRHTGTGR